MGYIPTILALLGFCFLWGIVNYNGIKVKSDFLVKKVQSINDDISERNRIISALLNEVIPSSLDNLNVHYFEEINSIVYSLKNNFYSKELKAQKWINELIDHLHANDYPDQNVQLLKATNERIVVQLQSYKKAARSYNKLIRSKPTYFMARLFNFREIPGINI